MSGIMIAQPKIIPMVVQGKKEPEKPLLVAVGACPPPPPGGDDGDDDPKIYKKPINKDVSQYNHFKFNEEMSKNLNKLNAKTGYDNLNLDSDNINFKKY